MAYYFYKPLNSIDKSKLEIGNKIRFIISERNNGVQFAYYADFKILDFNNALVRTSLISKLSSHIFNPEKFKLDETVQISSDSENTFNLPIEYIYLIK